MMQWYKVEFAESLFSEHHTVQFLQDLNEQKEHHDIPSTPAVNPSLRNFKVISGSEWMSNLPKVIYHCVRLSYNMAIYLIPYLLKDN